MTQGQSALLELCAAVLDTLVQEGLSTLVMDADSTKVDPTLAAMLATMEHMRDRRSRMIAELEKLDGALVVLEDLTTQLKGVPLSTAAPSPPDQSAPDSASPPAATSDRTSRAEIQADDSETSAETALPEPEPSRHVLDDLTLAEPHSLPVYYICARCYGFHDRDEPCSSGLSPEDLDRRHGQRGWVSREHRVITSADIERAALLRRIEQGRAAQSAPPAKAEVEAGNTPSTLRPGSKNHRIYEATKQLLEKDTPLHLDHILNGIQEKEPLIFDSVGDARMNLSNILSLLKSKRLLLSDRRGYWWLPNGRAAE